MMGIQTFGACALGKVRIAVSTLLSNLLTVL